MNLMLTWNLICSIIYKSIETPGNLNEWNVLKLSKQLFELQIFSKQGKIIVDNNYLSEISNCESKWKKRGQMLNWKALMRKLIITWSYFSWLSLTMSSHTMITWNHAWRGLNEASWWIDIMSILISTINVTNVT